MSEFGFAGEEFVLVRYYEHGKSGSGDNPSDPAGIESADVVSIPAGLMVEKAMVAIDTAITGSTAINLGDDDDADGYVPTASLTLGTPAVYGYGPDESGAYLNASGESRVKYYDSSSSGKEVKLAVTGASTAGKFRVILKGIYLGR